MIKVTASKYKVTITVIRRIVRDILDRNSMEELLRSIVGNQGQLGLDLAVADLKIFYFENKRIPKTKENGMITIRNSILSNKHWRKFGIKSWDDLLNYAFGEEQVKLWNEAKEKRRFEKAVNELKKFQAQLDRLPIYSDPEIYWISSSITRGIWKKYSIDTWNDMLNMVFDEINIDQNKYCGEEGFKIAINELLEFYQKSGKKPTANEFDTLKNAIYRGEWKNYGINKWNDMLLYVFGDVNLDLQNDYSGEESFARVQNKLRKFQKANGRIPKSTDIEVISISSAIARGVFKDMGILTWNDLLNYTYGKINKEPNKYKGRRGLDRAIKELKEFKIKHGKKPTTKDMDTFYKIIRKGKWKEFGINSWNDLLRSTFGEVHVDKERYKGKEGLNRALKELKAFKEKNGKKLY